MNEEAYRKAQKQVQKKREFYQHFGTYLLMGVFFLILNMVTSPGRFWFQWPLLGWGIGLAFHYIDVFGLPGIGEMSTEWEERAIQEELEKMKNNPKYQSKTGGVEERLELKELEKKKKTWDDSELV